MITPASRLQTPNVLRISDGTNTYLYEIAHNRQGERLWRETTVKVQPGQGELIKTWESWHTGMGWSRDETRDAEYAPPVYESGTCTATHRGYLYPSLAQTALSSGVQTTGVTALGRVTEMGGYIYFFGLSATNPYIIKVAPPGTVKYIRNITGWRPVGQPTEFGGYLYVPGALGAFKELTTIVGDLTAAWYYDGTNYTNNTTAAVVSGGTAFTLLADHTDDIFYFGAATKFDGIYFDIGTAAGSALTMDWEYWNGAAWTDMVSETDSTTGLTVDGWVTWASALQTDWATATSAATSMGGTPPDNTSRFWVRVKTSTETPWTAPTASWCPISDVWTDGPDSAPDRRRAKHMGTAGKLLWRVGDNSSSPLSYVVNSCSEVSSGGSGGPLVAANWSDPSGASGGYTIGKPGRSINSLAEMNRFLHVGKDDGLFYSDPDGNQSNALDFTRNLMGSYNCIDTIRWLGTLVTMGSNGRSLWQYTGASARPIGIETLEGNLSAIRGGRYIAFATAGEWLYVIYKVGSTSYLLAARPGHTDEPAIVWHELLQFTGDAIGLHVSSLNTNPTLYVLNPQSSSIFGCYITLAADGSPDPTDSSVTFSTTAANHDLSWVDWGCPGTPKRGHMAEVLCSQVKGTGGLVKVYHRWDTTAASYAQIGENITAVGSTRRGFTARSGDSGHRGQLRIQLIGDATNILRVEKVSLYNVALPRKEPALEFTLRLYPGGVNKTRDVKKQKTDLDTLSELGPLIFYDPDDPAGTGTFDAIIDTMEESKGEQIEKVEGERYVRVLARVMQYV